MKTGLEGRKLIKKWEGFRPTAYLCPAGVWTIGWGHTSGVKKGDTCTMAQAEKFLDDDLFDGEQFLAKVFGVKINQFQFDAISSFIFNVGLGNFKSSTLYKKMQVNVNDPAIKDEFVKWCKADGTHNGIDDDKDGLVDEAGEKQTLGGLLSRRKDEAELYFKK